MNVENNVTIKALEKKANGFIPKVNKIEIDGQKDNEYAYVGTLPRLISNKPIDDWEKDGRGLDAKLYASWDGEFIYYFIEVKDPKVVSFGKDFYTQVDDSWKGDKTELWFSVDNTFQMASLDSFGYSTHGNNFSEYMNENKLFKTSLIGDSLDNYQSVKPVLTSATGYNVEMAIPAYIPTSSNLKECEKMISNDLIYLSLQLNSADSFNLAMIEDAIEYKDLDKIVNADVNQCWTGKQLKNSKNYLEEDVWKMILE